MKKLTKLFALLLALIMVFSLVACTDGTTPSGNEPAAEDNTEGEKDTEPAEEQGNEDTEADSKYGGTLKMAMLVENSQVGMPITSGTDQNVVAGAAYERLGQYTAEGTIEGFLAKEIITDPENLTITLELQEGILFHDGTPFNAQAVVDVWDILKTEVGRESNFANVVSYEAAGEYEVVIKLIEWRADAVETLCITCGQMFSPSNYKAVGGLEGAYTSICGTGPFVQDEFVIGEKITFKKNENYWQEGLPYLDGVEVYVSTDQTAAVNMLKTGDINMVIYPSLENYENLIDAGFTRYGVDNCNFMAGLLGMFFASGKEGEAVSDLKVRQAICHAIDREALNEAFCDGIGVVTNQLAVPGAREYNDEVVGYDYDPEAAKALLAEAGYADGECEVTLTYRPADEDIWVAIQAMLEEVGIKVNLDPYDAIGDRIVVGGAAPYTSCSWWSAPTYATAWFRYFSANPTTMVGDAIDLKEAGIIDCYNNCMTAPDDATQKEYLNELAKLCVDEYCLYCPFYCSLSYYVGDDTVMDSEFGIKANTQWTPATTWLQK